MKKPKYTEVKKISLKEIIEADQKQKLAEYIAMRESAYGTNSPVRYEFSQMKRKFDLPEIKNNPLERLMNNAEMCFEEVSKDFQK